MSQDAASAIAFAERAPAFARVIEEHGHLDPFEWHDGGQTGASKFAAVVLNVVNQRSSGRRVRRAD